MIKLRSNTNTYFAHFKTPLFSNLWMCGLRSICSMPQVPVAISLYQYLIHKIQHTPPVLDQRNLSRDHAPNCMSLYSRGISPQYYRYIILYACINKHKKHSTYITCGWMECGFNAKLTILQVQSVNEDIPGQNSYFGELYSWSILLLTCQMQCNVTLTE